MRRLLKRTNVFFFKTKFGWNHCLDAFTSLSLNPKFTTVFQPLFTLAYLAFHLRYLLNCAMMTNANSLMNLPQLCYRTLMGEPDPWCFSYGALAFLSAAQVEGFHWNYGIQIHTVFCVFVYCAFLASKNINKQFLQASETDLKIAYWTYSSFPRSGIFDDPWQQQHVHE